MIFPQAPLGEHVDVVGGFAFKSETFSGEGVPVIRISDIQEGTVSIDKAAKIPVLNIGKGARFTVEPGDILIAMSGATTGKIGLAPQNLTGCVLQNQRVGNFKIKHPEKILKLYLKHFVCSDIYQNQVYSLMAGAAQPNISSSQLESITVPVPPIPEQRRIAAILDRADALRAKRREALAQLDSLTQSIFIEMFGDPSSNPKGWPTKRLSDLVISGDNINYGVIQPGDDVDEGIPLVRVGDLIDGGVRHELLKKITPEIESAYKRSRLHGDEILVSCVGTIGVVVLAKESEKGFNIARAVARIRLSQGTSREFVAAQLQTKSVQRYFTEELRTVSQPTLNIKQLSETKLIWPPTPLQAEFSNRIDLFGKLKFNAHQASSELDSLFTSLQHRAFQGEL